MAAQYLAATGAGAIAVSAIWTLAKLVKPVIGGLKGAIASSRARKAGKGACVFVFVAVLIDSIGFGIILPVLPRLIMQLTGVSIDRAAGFGGWLSFVYALMQFFCAPVLGNLSDRFGRRPVLLFALFAVIRKIFGVGRRGGGCGRRW